MISPERLRAAERAVTLHLIERAEAQGWRINIHDGERWWPTTERATLADLSPINERTLHFSDPAHRNRPQGYVVLVFGGICLPEMLVDWPGKLETFMAPLLPQLDRLQRALQLDDTTPVADIAKEILSA